MVGEDPDVELLPEYMAREILAQIARRPCPRSAQDVLKILIWRCTWHTVPVSPLTRSRGVLPRALCDDELIDQSF